MGGCASKPKDLNGQIPETLPSESQPELTSKPVEGDAPAETKTDLSKTEDTEKENKEEPLVDLSEPKPEVTSSDRNLAAEPKGADVDIALSELNSKAPTDSGDAKEDVPSTENVKDTQHVANVIIEEQKAAVETPITEKTTEKAEEATGLVRQTVDTAPGNDKEATEKEETNKSGVAAEGKSLDLESSKKEDLLPSGDMAAATTPNPA